jgi:hypothetical protein
MVLLLRRGRQQLARFGRAYDRRKCRVIGVKQPCRRLQFGSSDPFPETPDRCCATWYVLSRMAWS